MEMLTVLSVDQIIAFAEVNPDAIRKWHWRFQLETRPFEKSYRRVYEYRKTNDGKEIRMLYKIPQAWPEQNPRYIWTRVVEGFADVHLLMLVSGIKIISPIFRL